MNFNGHELKEITKPQIFDPPKKMLVWNNIMDYAITSLVVAIVERMDGICAICHDGEIYPYCAEIPEEPKPRRSTNRELAKRWRKVSEENPSEEMEGEDFLVSNGYYSVVCEWRGYWDNDPFCGDKNCDVVKFWMPLPLAPKEAK